MLLKAQITFASGRIDWDRSAAEPSGRSMYFVADPPIQDSSGPVASSRGFPAAPSLMESRVSFWAASGTVRIRTSAVFAASGFAMARTFVAFGSSSFTLSTAA